MPPAKAAVTKADPIAFFFLNDPALPCPKVPFLIRSPPSQVSFLYFLNRKVAAAVETNVAPILIAVSLLIYLPG